MLLGSGAVGDDRQRARHPLDVGFDVVGGNPNRLGDGFLCLAPRLGAPRVDQYEALASVGAALQLLRIDPFDVHSILLGAHPAHWPEGEVTCTNWGSRTGGRRRA